MPKGTFKRFWIYVKKTIRENKVATVIGILIGGVGTRFLEDGNLLVTTVITGMTTIGAVVFWRTATILRNALRGTSKR
jgi:hypothetical protein